MRFNLADNVVTRALSKLCDMVVLNILWLVCSVPIVTIGASTTAMYTVMLKLVKNEEGYIFSGFFKAFKENFKQSTIIWLILAVLSVIWWIDFRVAGSIGGNLGFVMRVIFTLLGFLLLSVILYVFPLTARYENSIKGTMKNALLLTIAKLPYTLLMAVIVVGAVVVSMWSVQMLMMALPVWFIAGVSVIAWLNSHILRRVFLIFEEKDR